MITATRFEVRCDAYDCAPERFAPLSRPLVVDARSPREAARTARAAGWGPAPGRGGWWCPRHVQVAAVRRESVGCRTGSETVTPPRWLPERLLTEP